MSTITKKDFMFADMIAQAAEMKRKPHIVIATPGRLADHLRSSEANFKLNKIRWLLNGCR